MSYRTRSSTAYTELKCQSSEISETSSIRTEKTEILFSSENCTTAFFSGDSRKGTISHTPNHFDVCPTIIKEPKQTEMSLLNEFTANRTTIKNNRRQKLKLKTQKTCDTVSSSSNITIQKNKFVKKNTNSFADEYERKRKIAETLQELNQKVYNPIKKEVKHEVKTHMGRMKLFDFKKKFLFDFRLFEENDLGLDNLKRFLIETKVDNDVETDDETLKYDLKKCKDHLKESIKEQREEKIKK
jgi:hypothetical protein